MTSVALCGRVQVKSLDISAIMQIFSRPGKRAPQFIAQKCRQGFGPDDCINSSLRDTHNQRHAHKKSGIGRKKSWAKRHWAGKSLRRTSLI